MAPWREIFKKRLADYLDGISMRRHQRPIPPPSRGTLRRSLRTALASGLLAPACLAAGAAATPADRPLLEFRDESYALNPVIRVHRLNRDEPWWLDYPWEVDNPVSRHNWHLARVRVLEPTAFGDSLRFKVEAQPDQASYELCYCPLAPATKECKEGERICHEIGVSITEQSGILYVVAPNAAPGPKSHYFRDFPGQRAELSVTEDDHKVYREVPIEPPAGTPDCSDYPDTDADRYACLYQRETMGPAPAANSTLLAALPDKLVQSKTNYEMVFAEEFSGNTGRYPAGNCEGGLSNLDGNKWNFREAWCGKEETDAPCQTLRNGHYEMFTVVDCNSGINTVGKFGYRYGYVETRYTVSLVNSNQQNMNMVIGDVERSLRYAAAKYNVPLRNYEEMAKALPMEINVFEYFPEQKRELTNWFYNFQPYLYYPHTEPRYTSNWTRFCADPQPGWQEKHQLNFFTVAQCATRTSITVTKGLEWTPRGYRMLVKVQDLHDDFLVVSKDSTPVHRRRALSNSTPTRYAEGVTQYTGATRDGFFEFLEPGNSDSVLTQFTIGHAPMYLHFGAWRKRRDEPDDLTPARMQIDYVRVFQPKDRYAGMEPVYE